MAGNSETLLKFTLVLSLLLFVSMAEANSFTHKFWFPRVGRASKAPSCEIVYGVSAGDTCSAVQQQFNLTPQAFSALNPNLVCEALFVGQWLCVTGTAA